ncbi:MAG: DUF3575 domain-containing protein [Muribaculaceae bacterium]
MKKQTVRRVYGTLMAIATIGVSAQTVGIKTNLLYDATLSPNMAIEMSIAPQWSVEVSGNYNDWAINKHQWKHWFVQPEVRYWLCENLGGHFIAGHIIAGEYNFGNLSGGFNFLGNDLKQLEDKRYQGWGAGVGIGYGYTWMLGRHWSIEAEIAVGWIYTRYDVYPCADCGSRLQDNRVHNYVGPTKAAVNLIYVF